MMHSDKNSNNNDLMPSYEIKNTNTSGGAATGRAMQTKVLLEENRLASREEVVFFREGKIDKLIATLAEDRVSVIIIIIMLLPMIILKQIEKMKN